MKALSFLASVQHQPEHLISVFKNVLSCPCCHLQSNMSASRSKRCRTADCLDEPASEPARHGVRNESIEYPVCLLPSAGKAVRVPASQVKRSGLLADLSSTACGDTPVIVPVPFSREAIKLWVHQVARCSGSVTVVLDVVKVTPWTIYCHGSVSAKPCTWHWHTPLLTGCWHTCWQG